MSQIQGKISGHVIFRLSHIEHENTRTLARFDTVRLLDVVTHVSMISQATGFRRNHELVVYIGSQDTGDPLSSHGHMRGSGSAVCHLGSRR
ncbi:hypothetical protein GUJ93_ZPchr0003g16870 [Zizania palustris]|uniref:Uncharacterized protein n=1 Tax=Zizania palustris TaxID=103762 RepID=A0A8J5SB57_ZIZPA|nr:hypothetical protein GUJ93_ZPchr0003g16870 [Zizania palustris]